ncbi:MAG: hypothetical protein JWO06_3520, partial [Bacteroidota bacterium]|nr:hypothetical protein [Bacteroidota bacterium]
MSALWKVEQNKTVGADPRVRPWGIEIKRKIKNTRTVLETEEIEIDNEATEAPEKKKRGFAS